MCTLVALWRLVDGYDIVLGMNRDESSGRPADPPSLLQGEPPIVAPRDRKGGGTWIGASGNGFVTALSNRPGHTLEGARSRGLLAMDALRQKSVSGVKVFLEREVRNHTYNFWNLMAWSRKEVRFFRYDGELSMRRGREGLNVLTNEGGNVTTDPKVQTVQGLLSKSSVRSIEDAVRILQSSLRYHSSSPAGANLCVHGIVGGTVSSTVLALSNADPAENILLYSDGAPCSTPYRDFHDAIRRLPGPS